MVQGGDAPALLAEAKERLARQDGAEARPLAQRALEMFKSAGDLEGQAAALHVLVRSKIATKHFSDAMVSAEDMLAHFRDAKDKKGEAVALNEKAAVHLAEKEAGHAEKLAGEARALAQELGDKKLEVATLRTLIKATAVLMPEEAAGIADSNEGLFKEVEGVAGEAAAVLLGAEARLAIGDAEENGNAVAAAKRAVGLLEKEGTKLQQAAAYQLRASACVACGTLEEGKKAAAKALALSREARDKIGQGVAACTIANIDIMKKDFDQAARNAEEGASIFAKAGDASKRADALLTVANAYSSRVTARVGNATKTSLEEWCQAAMNAAFTADQIFSSTGEKQGSAAAKHQAAMVFFAREQFSEALGTAQQAKDLFNEASDGRGVASCLLLMGQVYLNWQQVIEAGDSLSTATRLFKESGDMDGSDMSQGLFEAVRPYYDGAKRQQGQPAMSAADFDPMNSQRGHGWRQGVNAGHGYQMFRFMGLRGRPAANMKQ